MSDPVNHPSHYNQGKVECIDALEAATTGLAGIEAFNTASAIKYLWRWKQKNGVEDLKKARWYINRLVPAEPEPPRAIGEPLPESANIGVEHLRQLKAEWQAQILSRFAGFGFTGPECGALKTILTEVLR